MRVAITGGTGMLGTALQQALRARGDEVLVLTRRNPRDPAEVQWDPTRGISELARLESVDVVYNLAGASIGDRPWTRARRKELWESRIDSTRVLLESLGKLEKRPRVFIGAGGIGIFGDRGDDPLDDDAPHGTGFLAELALAWEEAHGAAEKLGCRVAVQRMGIVLAPHGGAFPLMVRPFRLGLGGWLGNGQQYVAWITSRDAVRAFLHLADHDACKGGFNASVPDAPRNKDWSRALGRALHRPVLTHAPKWAFRGAFGDLADSLFLASTRALPRKLLETGFTFLDTESEAAFHWLLEQTANQPS